MDIVWGIASYKRPFRQNMLNYLNRLGYAKDRIIVSTQTAEDYELYRSLHSDKAIVIYKEASNCPENKNTLLDYYCENYKGCQLMICSDKTEGVMYVGEDGNSHLIQTKEEMNLLVEEGFRLSNFYGAGCWGVYTTDNKYFMSRSTHINVPILGCFMGIVNPQTTRFDTDMHLKEDFELVFRFINDGGCVLRFNDVCLKAKYKTEGGSHRFWHSSGDKVNESCNQKLLATYPRLAKENTKRKNELRYVGRRSKINYSIAKKLWHITHHHDGATK